MPNLLLLLFVQVAAVLGLIAAAVVVCVCFITAADLHSSRRRVVMEALGAGGELEDEIALSRAIGIAVKTNQTDLLTFPAQFNATLSNIATNIDETDTASLEGSTEKEINSQYAFEGSDPW